MLGGTRRQRSHCCTALVLGTLGLSLVLGSSQVLGQTFLPDPVDDVAVAIQLEKPFLANADGLAAFSSIVEADALLPLGSMSLQLGLPVALAGADFVDGTSVYMGNVRASLLFGPPGELTSFISIMLPTASNVGGPDLAFLVAALPWFGEVERWIEENFIVSSAVLPSWRLPNNGQLGLRLGGAAILRTGFENLNLDARAAGWLRLPLATAELRAELASSYMVTSDDGFGEQFTAYLDVGTSLPALSGQPGLFVRVPLDGDGREVHDLSIGVSARF